MARLYKQQDIPYLERRLNHIGSRLTEEVFQFFPEEFAKTQRRYARYYHELEKLTEEPKKHE